MLPSFNEIFYGICQYFSGGGNNNNDDNIRQFLFSFSHLVLHVGYVFCDDSDVDGEFTSCCKVIRTEQFIFGQDRFRSS